MMTIVPVFSFSLGVYGVEIEIVRTYLADVLYAACATAITFARTRAL